MRQRDIPKVFRVPRPMAQSGRRQHPFWDAVPFEALAILLGAALALLLPLKALDDVAARWVLRAVAAPHPPASVVAVTLASTDVRSPTCRSDLQRVLEGAGATRAVVIPPATELCGQPTAEALDAHFVTELLPDVLEHDDAGRVVAIRGEARARAFAEWLGLQAPQWIASRPARSVPSVRFEDLSSRRVPTSMIAHRVVVVGIEDGLWGEDFHGGSGAQRIAGGLGAALDEGPRLDAPRWTAALLVLFCGAALAFLHARRGLAGWGAALLVSLVLVWTGNCAGAALGAGWLLPTVSFSSGLLITSGGLLLPRALAAWRAFLRATELIERAALFRTQSVHTIPDREFWVRAASLASQAHPSDGVLIAELPPHRWHLRFWPNGAMGENMVAERRRDIRRAPYCDESGAPAIGLAHNYLAMKGVPALVIPLIAFGDVEGYVFLCGASAEQAYLQQPELAERLSVDLGILLRRRRLGSLREDDWRRTAGSIVRQPERRTATLIEGARVALDDLRLFGAVLREAPVGLLFADAFADVRLVGREFARWLPLLGVTLPAGATDGPLAPGQLGLAHLLEAVQGDGSLNVARIAQSSQPVTCRIQLRTEADVPVTLELSLRPLHGDTEGGRSVVGYVASLVEVEEQRAKLIPLPAAASADALTVVGVADLLADTATSAARASGHPVRFESPRFSAHVILQGRSLPRAFREFLVDAAGRCPPGRGPVLAVQQRRHHVQVDLMDLALGLPEAAFKRALRAPGAAPPEGLESFAHLVKSVEDSHGHVVVQGGAGWGVQVSLRLLRAKVALEPTGGEDAPVVELASYSQRGGS